MNVTLYEFKSDMILLDRLFLTNDQIYIQSYDPVNGRPQMCFLPDKTLIGKISSDTYWKIEKELKITKI